MNGEFLAPLIPIAAIIAFAVVKIVKIRAAAPSSLSTEVGERLDALESTVHGLQQDLAEAQDRLDFAERLLSQAREERRIGG
jgi:hypothetical protein